jgi:hypothetical protein
VKRRNDFVITARRTVTDPAERARRLARAFAVFKRARRDDTTTRESTQKCRLVSGAND